MNSNQLSSYKKREVRVFISSTFRDMMIERETLIKKVFPNLRAMFKDRGVNITEVDLRWGVLEEEAENGKVIEICLNEIDKSRPYFIGILGERYGWIPDVQEYEKHKKIIEDYPWVMDDIQSDLSITEMEIQYGVLRNPGMIERSAFFIREMDADGSGENEKQKKLKETIAGTTGLRKSYYSNAADLAEMITQHLAEVIDSDFPAEEDNLDLQPQLNFINSQREAYVKNDDYYYVINSHFENSNTPLVITGETGIGKSTLLANYLLDYAANNPEDIYLCNFSNASLDSSDYIKVLQRFCEELSGRNINLGEEFPSDTMHGLLRDFVKLLSDADSHNILIVLDGIDEFIDDEITRLLDWMPDEFPDHVRVIYSCGDSQQLKRVKELKYRIVELNRFDDEQKESFITNYFNTFSKKLPKDIVAKIIDDEISGLPLTLKSFACELKEYGVHEGLKQRVKYYLDADGPVEFYDRVLARLEEDFNTEEDFLVKNILSVIALFNSGIKEKEIQEILNITPLQYAAVFNSIVNNLTNQDGNYRLSNNHFKNAVEKKYLADTDQNNRLREKIIDYLKNVVWGTREIAEVAHQLVEIGDIERLHELLSDFRPLLYLHTEDRYSLIQYWNLLKNDYKIVETYTDEVIRDFLDSGDYGEEGILTAYNVIASLLYDLGFYVESEPYFQKIFELSMEKLGGEAEYTYSNLKRLLNLKVKLGKLDDAEKYATQLLEIATSYYSETDQIYIQSIYQVGRLYFAQEKYDEAIEVYHRAAQLLQNYFDDPKSKDDNIFLFHVDLIEDMTKCYLYMELFDDAVTEGEEVLGMKINLYGEESSEVAETYKTFGAINCEVGRFDDAIKYFKKGYEINSKLYGKSHPLAMDAMKKLKNVYALKSKEDGKINL